MNAGIVIFGSIESREEVSLGRAHIVKEQIVLNVGKVVKGRDKIV